MHIRLSQLTDVEAIFKLYNDAIAYQITVKGKPWKGFEHQLIKAEIAAQKHYVITQGNSVACTFVLTFTDEAIWKQANADAAVYIHRIAVNSAFRGKSYVKIIIEWLKQQAKKWDFKFIRLDTESGNQRINNYYLSCGFIFKGTSKIDWQPNLPLHYKNATLSLFEIAL